MERSEPQTKPGLVNITLLVGDLVCFLIFAGLGLRSHEDGVTASGLLRAAVPFQVGWLVFSFVTGLQRKPTTEPRELIKTWVPAWIVGLVLRSLVFGRPFAPTFAVIAFLFNSVLLFAWRGLIAPRLLKAKS